ncbi:MAG: hypothetical protein SFX18_09165 [Pirellulales bacterium]|nr:hypothetical protein [Pirellulales bacterium]
MSAKNRLPAATPPASATRLLGVAFDARDGHKRLTRGESFTLVGGSEETHATMQEATIKLTEKLSDRGKRLADASPAEICDILHDVLK